MEKNKRQKICEDNTMEVDLTYEPLIYTETDLYNRLKQLHEFYLRYIEENYTRKHGSTDFYFT